MKMTVPQYIMPVVYHPTTIIAVDDNKNFLSSLALLLSDEVFIRFFSDPIAAINYLNKQYKASPFSERCLTRIPNPSKRGKDYSLKLNSLINEIYNPRRFEEKQNVLVDYAMPEMNGLQFCESIHDRNICTLLLTGEAGYELVEGAFLNGAINQFIRKDEDNLAETLLKYIQANQFKNFQQYSYTVLSLLSPEDQFHNLFDPQLVNFLRTFIQQHQICEYYLYDKQGSYLLLDKDANCSWFILRTEDSIEQSISLAKEFHAPASVIDALTKREKLLSIDEKNNLIGLDKINWEEYLYSVSIFNGNKKYYYAHINNLAEFNLDKSKILSYNEFLRSAK